MIGAHGTTKRGGQTGGATYTGAGHIGAGAGTTTIGTGGGGNGNPIPMWTLTPAWLSITPPARTVATNSIFFIRE